MPEPFHFDLVSPERLLISEEVEEVVVPGAEGYFTVLKGHAPFMTTLRPGVVEINRGSPEARRLYVRAGFADVTATGLTILAEYALPMEEVDGGRLDQEIREAEEDLQDAGEDAVKRTAAEKRLSELRDVRRWLIPA
ncbi:MAG TPA: F0F1 ATP synthase subunit epsilon [Afifellaceae bacterium]|nr:F0F1 ATP synthase subunit epsilon [Afifellaceae bacterium]